MSVMDNQQFVVGKDIDFEFSGSSSLQGPGGPVENEAGPSNASSKKKRKKKKKKASTKAQVRLHADGQGLTIDNIDATMESDLLEAANTVAQSLGGSMEKAGPALRGDSLKWSLDRLEMVANRSKKSPFWDLSPDQKHQIHNFWINLSEAERRNLLRLEKEREDVLRIDKKLSENKYRQNHKSCSCSGCGRKRNAWQHKHEGEMEKIYDEYSAELEYIADCFTKGLFTDDNESLESANESHNFADENALSAEFETGTPDYYDEEDIQEEAELLAEMTAERRKNKGSRLGGGILSVADDLLQNDGKRFVDVMEQMAEYKVIREIDMAARHDAAVYVANQNRLKRGDFSDLEDDDFDDEDEDDLDCDEDDEEDEDEDEDDHDLHTIPFDSSTGDVAKVMLRGFATRTFEYRILLAFREHIAKQRQMSLFAELEAEEARVREEKEQKKLRDREKRKDKKRAQQKLKEEERARKEQERKAKEEAQKAKEEAARLARLEEQRLKQEAHRAEIEERLKKLALEEEREREREKERKEQERKEAELREKERLKAEAEAAEAAAKAAEEAEARKREREKLEAERLKQEEQQRLIARQQSINEQALQEELAAAEAVQRRHETPVSSDWNSGPQEEEVRGWSPLGGLYPTNNTPVSRAPVGSTSQWSNWPLGSTSPISMPLPIGTAPGRSHVGGSLWSSQSIWSTSSLDSVLNAAILSYDRLVFEGAAVDGYIPSQALYQATVKALGNSMLSQTDFYSACGVATNNGPFFCLRDSVGIVTHLRRK